MRNRPDLLSESSLNFFPRLYLTYHLLLELSLFALQCIDSVSKGSPTLSPVSVVSSALTLTSDTTVVYQYTPIEYERTTYYNGITSDGDHPELIYRSDYLSTPFPKPVGRFACIPVKSLHGVYDTALNGIWETVGPKIVDLITARKIKWSSVDPARFFTHLTSEEDEKGNLGPVVIWVGVSPGSTSSDTAHEVSQEILVLLREHGVEDVVVEWREAVLQRLAGPPFMRHVNSTNPTHHVRRFLTALLGVPLAVQGMEAEDEGTLTLWFHENKGKDGNPSYKVYGVSNCHVLRKNITVDYEHKGGAPKDFVRVCGLHRFQRGLDEIKTHISSHSFYAELYTQEIDGLEAMETQDEKVLRHISTNQRNLNDAKEAIRQLEALYDEVTKHWPDIKLHRDIGYVQHAEAIKVDVEGGTRYTSDWGAFVVAEAKVKDQFEGNVVDLGSKYRLPDIVAMFCPRGGGANAFQFPLQRKLRIVGCATKEDLTNPTEFDSEGERCFIVGKDGNTTDLTVGRYAGLVSFTLNDVGVVSVELGIYNSGLEYSEVFSAKGDSGSLVWHTKDSEAYIVGQLHSGENKGGSTSNYISYCTPGWYLLAQIKKQYPHADFYRDTW
ncbi:hypothetical protein D9615_008320 [Tricholomella constricta]|uniref:Uncharacterized protein n=1 Tax=Tricholomella constricta TaxID=117010 RepID=A0A8H5HE57_9AGAR|nr:hypothetical protein D9615_008320 [Tricholomella constricta]